MIILDLGFGQRFEILDSKKRLGIILEYLTMLKWTSLLTTNRLTQNYRNRANTGNLR